MIVSIIIMAVALLAALVVISYLLVPYIKHKTAIKRFKDHYNKEENAPDIEEVYIDKLGNKWYGFPQGIVGPAKRIIEARISKTWADLSMTVEFFDVKMKEQFAALSKGDLNTAATINQELQQRRTLAAETHSMELMINCLYMLDGENPAMPDNDFLKKKRAIWDKDPECHAFFLTAAFGFMRNTSPLSKEDLAIYLNSQMAKDLLLYPTLFQRT